MQTQRPNLIFVFADQLRYQACGYAGDKRAHTPFIDAFSREAVNFQNAVVSMPVCCATRATFFTGKYTTSTGMVINELRINPNHHKRCLAHCLKDAGYNTGYIGKWHLWANELGNHYDVKNSYIPPGPYRLGFDGYWAAYNFHHEYYNTYYHENSPERIYYGEGVYEPDAQTTMALNFISEKMNNSEPFSLFLSYGTPHDPWREDNVPKEDYNLFRDMNFPLPVNYGEKKDPYGDAWSNIETTPQIIQEWMRVYYAMTTNLDRNFGRILKFLKEKSLEENTIVVFTSDHGEMFGAHGRMKKNIFYEEAARVPMLIRWPGVIPEGLALDTCFNSVDIMPTLLGLMNIDIPEEAEGMNLSHLAKGEPGPEPEFAFLQNTGACADWEDGHEWRAIRDKQYTYAVYRVDGKELLFDNISDPYQLSNLAEKIEFSSVLNSFRKKLKRKMKELNDTFPASSWYKEHWIKDRKIIKTAKNV